MKRTLPELRQKHDSLSVVITYLTMKKQKVSEKISNHRDTIRSRLPSYLVKLLCDTQRLTQYRRKITNGVDLMGVAAGTAEVLCNTTVYAITLDGVESKFLFKQWSDDTWDHFLNAGIEYSGAGSDFFVFDSVEAAWADFVAANEGDLASALASISHYFWVESLDPLVKLEAYYDD